MSERKIVIGIQARSTNTRLPRKCYADIGGLRMLDRVIRAATNAANYINRGGYGLQAQSCLVIPTGDEIGRDYGGSILTIDGPEDDVLTRYMGAVELLKPDYLVRITSDCPLIPPGVISKHILTACKNDLDYLTNGDEEVRTWPDGWDCEAISARGMHWLNEHAVESYDREHVTTMIRREPPEWLKRGNIIGYADLSQLKISVDTKEDLEFVRGYFDVLSRKIDKAKASGAGFFRA